MRNNMRFALSSVALAAHACLWSGAIAAWAGQRRRAMRLAPRRRRAARRPRRPRVLRLRGEGPASAPAKEAVITTMPMDVPSGTDLVLTLETPVSSETAKADQPVRAKVAKPVVVAGMEVIPEGAHGHRSGGIGRAIGPGEGPRVGRAALQ